MYLYYFNKPNDLTLYKMKITRVSKDPFLNIPPITMVVEIDPEDDVRIYDPYQYCGSMEVSAIEGVVRYRRFWLEEEDDERAEKIKEEYLKTQLNKLEKQLNKFKEKL